VPGPWIYLSFTHHMDGLDVGEYY